MHRLVREQVIMREMARTVIFAAIGLGFASPVWAHGIVGVAGPIFFSAAFFGLVGGAVVAILRKEQNDGIGPSFVALALAYVIYSFAESGTLIFSDPGAFLFGLLLVLVGGPIPSGFAYLAMFALVSFLLRQRHLHGGKAK